MVAATATTLTSAGAWKGGGAPIVGGAGRVDAPALRHSSGGSSGSCNYSRDASAPHARRVKVVLLESIHPRAVEIFKSSNFEVETYSTSLSGPELVEIAADAHILGIRSKTQLPKEFFDSIGTHAHRLWAVGCFCIGTNQVDLGAAAAAGVTVFNAPFSNTRSVAEITLSEAIALRRKLFQVSADVHAGKWSKTAKGCHEVRGKTLGIVGYGRIGSQLSIMAEALGFKVIFYDGKRALALGNAEEADSLEYLLQNSDIVTLHVPGSERTKNMIRATELAMMKPGSQLINNARGDVVDLDDLAASLESGHLSGAAVDVYPKEPKGNTDFGAFDTPLLNLPNVILTPHIGGSTEEAQVNIAEEVSEKLITLLSQGSTLTAVNVPEVELGPPSPERHRVLHFHNNVPGVMAAINQAVGDLDVNIAAQYLKTDEHHGYIILDVERKNALALKTVIRSLPHTIWCRSLLRSSGKFGNDEDIHGGGL